MRENLTGCLSAAEASLTARISRERLLRRVQEGEIEGQLVGGRYVISERSLAEYISRRATHGRLSTTSNAR